MLSKTMRMTQIFLLFSLVQSTFIYAEENNQSVTTVSTSEHTHKMKEFEWEFVLASEQIKDSEKGIVSGQYSTLKNSFVYSLSEQDQVRLFGSYVIEHYKNYKDKNYFEFGELMYRRKSLLNETEHFLNLDFELKHGVVLDSNIRNYWGFSSETIPQLIFKKRLGNGYGVELKARHHFFHRNNAKARTIAHEDRFYLSGYKMFGHQFLVNTELKYRHKIYTGAFYSYEKGGMMNKNYEELVFHPSLMYFLDRKTLIEGYVETKLNTSFDNKKWNRVAEDELILGGTIYFTII